MQEPIRVAWLVAGLALSLGLTTALGALLGQYLDGRWGTGPWLTLVGTLTGLGAGFLEMWTMLRRVAGPK